MGALAAEVATEAGRVDESVQQSTAGVVGHAVGIPPSEVECRGGELAERVFRERGFAGAGRAEQTDVLSWAVLGHRVEGSREVVDLAVAVGEIARDVVVPQGAGIWIISCNCSLRGVITVSRPE
jgi:hypothetical protein